MLKKGEHYKIECSEDRYVIHKEQKADHNVTLTIETVENKWGIFILKRCFRSFNNRYYVEVQFLREVENADHGYRILNQLTKQLENDYNAPIKTEVTEYYEKKQK